MTKKLQHIFALSEKGAKDLVKAVIWCFVCNLALMFPVGAVLFTVQHLLSCLEDGSSPMDGFWIYVGFALAVLLLLFVLHWFQYASLYNQMLIGDNAFTEFKGAFTEQYVLQQLLAAVSYTHLDVYKRQAHTSF